MAKIKATILNFHGINSHLEILLEDKSAKSPSFFIINQWSQPYPHFASMSRARAQAYIDDASSTFDFEIDADPKDIARTWATHWIRHINQASILNHNCADAVQWFLKKYANVPNPSPLSAPITFNHAMFGLFVPSFIPIGVTLPGRVMDNAKHHLISKKDIDEALESSSRSLKLAIAFTAACSAISIIAMIGVSIFVSGGLLLPIYLGCAAAAGFYTYNMFKAVNRLTVKELALEKSRNAVNDEAIKPNENIPLFAS